MDQGTGVMQQRRYYFNKSTKQCEQFYYRGANGNRNNFGSLQQCQQQCPVFKGILCVVVFTETPSPCAYGSSFPQTPCHGSNVMNDPCGSSQFCHIGQSPPTTVCCNRSPFGDRCSQALNTGIGNANLQRWYFNVNSEQCEPFIYRGLQGNENNFLNQQDCESACFVNPCAVGTPYRKQGAVVQCSPGVSSACPTGYSC
ncbi:unnamed protein product, partial [Gongylonema pulchrum]|uniref:Kunitz/Bovine pancreatic trypsin inhibitor domain protein n=1 Tax=Gongylonema pulchrum TaxID=637853 RepID=A0A183D9I7_9BILA